MLSFPSSSPSWSSPSCSSFTLSTIRRMSWIFRVSPFAPESTRESDSALASALVDDVEVEEDVEKPTCTSPPPLADGPVESQPVTATTRATVRASGASRERRSADRVMACDLLGENISARGRARSVQSRSPVWEACGPSSRRVCLPFTKYKAHTGPRCAAVVHSMGTICPSTGEGRRGVAKREGTTTPQFAMGCSTPVSPVSQGGSC